MTPFRAPLATLGLTVAVLTAAAAQVRDQGGAAPAGAATVTGQVEIAVDGRRLPLRRATVTLSREADRRTWTVATGADGRFEFGGLAPGSYKADVTKAGYARVSPPEMIRLTADARALVTVDVQLAGAVEGRVIDDRGLPLERLKIVADLLGDAGQPAATYSATTDDLGRYRVHTLPPGRYHVRMRPPAPASGGELFYPAATHAEEAAVLTVASGQTVALSDVIVATGTLSAEAAEALAAVEREITAPEVPGLDGRITGRVTRADLGLPIPNAAVRLLGSTNLSLRTVLTDGDGRYAFPRLPPGRYGVAAAAPGFLPADASTGGSSARIATVSDAARGHRIDVSLDAACAIEVRVVDEHGEPAPGVVLQITPRSSTPPSLVPAPRGATLNTGPTDDRGWFRAYRLPAGEYHVIALPEPFARSGPALFAPTFFPGVTMPSAADVVHVSAGADALHVAFALAPAASSVVTGVAVRQDGQRAAGASLTLLPMADGRPMEGVSIRMSAQADGSFAFRNLPDGPYLLHGSVPGWLGTTQVTASAATDNLPSLVLTLLPPGTARGRVIFEGAAPPGESHMLFFLPTDPTALLSTAAGGPVLGFSVVVAPDGRFTFRNLWSAGVITHAPRPSSSLVLARVLLQGRDITDVPYDFAAGEVDGLEVVLTSRVATVTGTAQAADGVGAGVTIVLFGAESSSPYYLSRTTRSGRTNDQGAFEFTRLLPGRYYAVATRSEAPDPSQVTALKSVATLVTVSEGSNPPLTLTVIR